MINITIKTIPHDLQRYPTVGDWEVSPENNVTISVSDMGDWKFEALVGLHELVEVMLCAAAGIRQQDVDAFDIAFEDNRIKGIEAVQEPGDHPDAPYFKQHQIASRIEKEIAKELKVNWFEYEKTVNDL